MRRIFLFSSLIGIGFGIAVFIWIGDILTRPVPATTTHTHVPLPLRPLTYPSASGVTLSAWFAPGSPGAGAVLLLHPVRSNKQAMLSRAQFLSARGFAVLLVDLQAHGESAGDRITFGYREAADVPASLAILRDLAPGERLGVLGVSLGAAAFVLANTHAAVHAAVLESLYPTIEEAVANRLRLRFGALGPWLSPLLLVQLKPRLGVTPAQLRPIEHVPVLQCPVLVVHGTEDRHTTIQEATRLFTAASEPKEFYALPGAAHVDLHAFGGQAYENKVSTFLARYLRLGD